MSQKNLYIIAGPNGAGKTTASFTILPEILECKEFINADEIAKGLSPFQPERVSFEAGRIMLNRINELIDREESFAFETTLSSKHYRRLIIEAQAKGYYVTLLYFWLESVDLAKTRVATRVKEGGHNIEPAVIVRRYNRGVVNLFEIYLNIVNEAFIFDNTNGDHLLLAEINNTTKLEIIKNTNFELLKSYYDTARNA